MEDQIRYVIPGDPTPLARARYGKYRVYDSQKQLKLIHGINIANQHKDRPMYEGPLKLEINFFLEVPKSAPKSKIPWMVMSYHHKKPDLSNLVKFLEDIATGVLYHDDCIIAKIECSKVYDLNPRTEFTITELKKK